MEKFAFEALTVTLMIHEARQVAFINVRGLLTSGVLQRVLARLQRPLRGTGAMVMRLDRAVILTSRADWGVHALPAGLDMPNALIASPQNLPTVERYVEVMRNRGAQRRAFTCSALAEAWALREAALRQEQAAWRRLRSPA